MDNGAEPSSAKREEHLGLAQQLVVALETDDREQVRRCMQLLNKDSEMYQQVGKIARDVHDNMLAFLSGSELVEMTHGETEETRKRLAHVLEMTDRAAHETLGAAENINNTLRDVISAQEAGELDDDTLRQSLDAIHGLVNGIVLSQSYQDLSGQIITRAITLVSNIEAQLIDLLTLAGLELPQGGLAAMVEDTSQGHGPRVAGTSTGDSLAGQDEVDDLLTSLGF